MLSDLLFVRRLVKAKKSDNRFLFSLDALPNWQLGFRLLSNAQAGNYGENFAHRRGLKRLS